MKKVLSLFSLISLFFTCHLYAQRMGPTNVNNEIIMSPYFDFYAQNNLTAINAGMGLTGIAGSNDISGISLNPASLDLQSKYEVKAEYSLRNDLIWTYSVEFSDSYLRQSFPAGALFLGYRINDKFQTGFSYRNDINYKIDFGYVYAYNENGQLIETQKDYLSFNTHAFTIPFLYKYKIFKTGINLNYILYTGHNSKTTMNINGPENNFELNTTFGRFVPEIGIQILPVDWLTFGLTYTQGFGKNIVKDWGSVFPGFQTDTTITHFPSKLGLGVSFKLFNNKLLLESDYRFENTSKNSGLKDRNNIYFGADYSINENWNIRTGFFTMFDNRVTYNNHFLIMDYNEVYDQYFITFGAGYNIKGFSFNLAFMNSTLFYVTKVGHTLLNGSASYNF